MKTLTLNHARQTTIFNAIAAVALTFGASVALSDPEAYTPASQIVRFTELDLSKPADVARLYSRIKLAARNVCHTDMSPAAGERTGHDNDCYEATVDNAIARVNRHALTLLHHDKTTKTLQAAAK
jgi:UrcA family protein